MRWQAVTLLAVLWWPAAALGGQQSIVESASYTMGDNDSRNSARQACVSTARRSALDRAGSLFESELTVTQREGAGRIDDQARSRMRSYVAAVTAVEVVDQHIEVRGDQQVASCAVRVTFDPEAVKTKLQEIAGNGEMQRRIDAQQAQINALKDRVAETDGPWTKYQKASREVAQAAGKSKLSARSAEWIRLNPWFNFNRPMHDSAISIHHDLVREGVVVDSDDYFHEIARRMAIAYPTAAPLFLSPGEAMEPSQVGGTRITDDDVRRSQIEANQAAAEASRRMVRSQERQQWLGLMQSGLSAMQQPAPQPVFAPPPPAPVTCWHSNRGSFSSCW